MSFRNPSPPLDYETESVSKPITTVLPIIVKLVDNVMSGNIDGQNLDSMEDTPLERSLCAVWDLAGIEEYAVVMVENHLPIVILKVYPSNHDCLLRTTADSISFLDLHNYQARSHTRAGHWCPCKHSFSPGNILKAIR
jgi:hypothetical protein